MFSGQWVPGKMFYLIGYLWTNFVLQKHGYLWCFQDSGSLRWRHNGRNSVSNHQPHDCLLNPLFRRRSKKISKLRVTGLCAGIHRRPVNSPHKWPVTPKMFPFDDVIMCQGKYIKVLSYWIFVNKLHSNHNHSATIFSKGHAFKNVINHVIRTPIWWCKTWWIDILCYI